MQWCEQHLIKMDNHKHVLNTNNSGVYYINNSYQRLNTHLNEHN